jgi:hypothetical protein
MGLFDRSPAVHEDMRVNDDLSVPCYLYLYLSKSQHTGNA